MRLLPLLLAWLAFAGTEPKAKPEDYPVHTQSGEVAISAEYMVRSFSNGELTYIAPDYLVVEIALFPPKGKTIQPNPGHFALRLNGKKQTISPQSPTMVAASLTHPEWSTRPYGQAGAGYGNTGVILGGPPRNDYPFPGAPPVARLPRPPQAPDPDDRSGIERAPKATPQEVLTQTALPEDEHRGPVSGFLFFPYSGKIGAIKSLDLIYQGAVLHLK